MRITADSINKCGRFHLESTGFPRYETIVRDPWNGVSTITSDSDVIKAVASLDTYFHETKKD